MTEGHPGADSPLGRQAVSQLQAPVPSLRFRDRMLDFGQGNWARFPPGIVLAVGRIQIVDKAEANRPESRQLTVSVQFPAHARLARALRPSRVAVCGVRRLAGHMAVLAFGQRVRLRRQPSKQGLGEEWRQ